MNIKRLESLSVEEIREIQRKGFVQVKMSSTGNDLAIYGEHASLTYQVGHVSHYGEEKQKGLMSEVSEVFAHKRGPLYIAETIIRMPSLERKTIGYCITQDGANQFCHRYALKQAKKHATDNGGLDIRDSSRSDTLNLYLSHAEMNEKAKEWNSSRKK